MLRQTPNRRHRLLAPASSDLESSYESRPGYHPVEVHTQAGPAQVSLHNQAVKALGQLLHSRLEICQDSVCNVEVLRREIVPDFVQVLGCKPGENEHYLGWARRALAL